MKRRSEGCFTTVRIGSGLCRFCYDELSETSRQMMIIDLETSIERDPRVIMGSVTARVVSYDSRSVTIETEFMLINDQKYL
jgi:hypothetical protein